MNFWLTVPHFVPTIHANNTKNANMPAPKKVKKRGKIYWRVRFNQPSIGITDIDKLFSSKRDAIDFIEQTEAKYKKNRTVIKSKHRFSELIQHAENNRDKIRTRGDKLFTDDTWKVMVMRWKFLSNEAGFKTVPVKDLTWDLIHARLNVMKEERDWKTASKYRYESDLSVLMNYAERLGWITHNPIGDAKSTDRINTSDQRNRVVSQEEFAQLLKCAEMIAATKSSPTYLTFPMFIRFIWETGCRVGELHKLTFSNIKFLHDDDFGAQVIFLGKTTKNRDEKVTFISKELAQIVRRFKIATNEDRIFVSRYYEPFADAKRLAGLDEPDERYGETITFHHLRHSFATHLAASGAAFKELKDAGGWKTGKMVDRYLHPTEESVRSALLKRKINL